MLSINLHDFVPRSRANGPCERTVIWVQGCPHRCPGCFNPDAQAFVNQKIIKVDELENQILKQKGIAGITISGGEPFSQAKALTELAKKMHEHKLTVVCYTGYTLEELQFNKQKNWNAFLEEIDLLIDGPFIQAERCYESYKGSKNQKLHFLSGGIKPKEIDKYQVSEHALNIKGEISQTGFPDILSATKIFAEVNKILS